MKYLVQLTSKYTLAAICAVIGIIGAGCQQDPKAPDNNVQFESDALGIAADENSITIQVNFDRAITSSATLAMNVTTQGVDYGTDFTTDPAIVSGVLSLSAVANTTNVNFVLTKVAGALFDGDETITFALQGAGQGLVPAGKTTLTLTFAEILAASGSMEVNGGGATYPNKVFIDLSGNRQTAISRTAWDLGFASGTDFRVILNSSNGMMARQLNKNDLTQVTAADTVGWGAQLSLEAVFAAITSSSPPAWVSEAINWIDDPTGDLTKTAIMEISATAADNKVYIINRGDAPGTPAPKLGWKKIRILRNGSGYTLQYANIDATNFTEVQIAKDNTHRFDYFSLNTHAVDVEPVTGRWDIAWTGFTNSTNFGSGPVPYYFQDIILTNRGTVQVAKVMTAAIAYANFTETDIAGQTFSSSQLGIGSDWRSGGGPGVSPAIRTDRYYIVKDGDGNYYKLRFTALTTSGERGRPQLEFALVKKG